MSGREEAESDIRYWESLMREHLVNQDRLHAGEAAAELVAAHERLTALATTAEAWGFPLAEADRLNSLLLQRIERLVSGDRTPQRDGELSELEDAVRAYEQKRFPLA
jgi:hypothetical protein